MEYLLDPDRPQFTAWVQVYNIDVGRGSAYFTYTEGQNRTYGSPLYYAALCGFQDLAKHLMDKYPQYVDAKGGYYMTPVVAAVLARHFGLAQLLYERGADIDVRDDNKRTALFAASELGDPEITQWLLTRGANPNFNTYNLGFTPLHAAALDERIEAARILLQHNANTNALNFLGETPLHHASKWGSPNVARLLLEHGADIDAREDSVFGCRFTPLHRASYSGYFEVVRVLIEHGANIDAEEEEGKKALQIALEREHHDIAKLLSHRGSQ
jgi:ankyrin repeat protein